MNEEKLKKILMIFLSILILLLSVLFTVVYLEYTKEARKQERLKVIQQRIYDNIEKRKPSAKKNRLKKISEHMNK